MQSSVQLRGSTACTDGAETISGIEGSPRKAILQVGACKKVNILCRGWPK